MRPRRTLPPPEAALAATRLARSARLYRVAAALGALLASSAGALHAAPAALLALEARIALPGVRGRIDHLALDAARRRLFVAALGNDSVEVVDLAAGERRAPLAGCARPTGLAFLPQRGRLAVACSGDGALALFDAASLAKLGEVGGLDDADNVRVGPDEREILVGFGDGAIAVVETDRLVRVATLPLPAHPESFQRDASGRLLVNLPGARAIGVLARSGGAAFQRWSTGARRGNYPMALDAAARRLWVAFRRPPALVAYDVASGAEVAALPACGDADDLFLDARRGRVYVVCGDGFVDVATSDARPALLSHVATRRGARTGLFSPDADALYVAAPSAGSAPAEVRVYRPR